MFHNSLYNILFIRMVVHSLFLSDFQPLSMFVMLFSYTPDITPKFDTIFRIRGNSVTSFFSVEFFVHLFLVYLNNWFCQNCEILCSYLLAFLFFAINLFFTSSVTRFIPFSTLCLVFISLIFIFPFPPVFHCHSLASLLISPLRLVLSLSILLFHNGSLLSPLLPFFTSTFLQPKGLVP